jgi:glycosyl transferase family 87
MRSSITKVVFGAALLWHGLSVLAPGWAITADEHRAFDFSSYYYAVRVAFDGGDPYDTHELRRVAAADGTEQEIFPYVYPPPFLLAMAWASKLRLVTAYRIWLWIDEIAVILGAVALAMWWRPLGALVPLAIAMTVAFLPGVANNHLMGQVNAVVLAFGIAGLWAEERGRSLAGGVLVGIASMMKVSPALFVLWWLLHGRRRAAVSAVLTSIALTLISLVLIAPKIQWRFYAVVLPSFASGVYNRVGVPISLFGNWSIPAFFHRLFPNPAGTGLGGTAHALSSVAAFALIATMAWLFRRDPREPFARAAQAAAVAVVMLLVPVYTFEHHLVWSIPAVVVATIALARGRLDGVAIALGIALGALAFDNAALQELAEGLTRPGGLPALLLSEVKLLVLLQLLTICVIVGRTTSEQAQTTKAPAQPLSAGHPEGLLGRVDAQSTNRREGEIG